MNLESVETMRSSTSIVVAAKDQISCDLAGEEVILDLKSGVYYGLDAVGARIWQFMQEPRSIAQIRELIMAEYEVDRSECESDLMEFLGTLVENGLVVEIKT